MVDIKQASMLELAIDLMKNSEGAQPILEVIKKVLELKEIDDPEGYAASQLYMDITGSSDFVFVGDGKWDLKERNNLDVYDRDGSFYSVAEEEDEEEDNINLADYDVEEESDGDEDDEDEDNEDEDEEGNENYNDSSFDKYDDPETANEDDDEENYLDEEKYNDIMDDYEDMYDKE